LCIIVYLAADSPLPLVPWDAARPAFHVTELPTERAAVRGQFARPHVYYAGSHEGCGCGFQYGEYELDDPDADELAEEAQRRESRKRLTDYLTSALTIMPSVELYACWDGDEILPREHASRIQPQMLIRERTFFRKREHMLVQA
jgi:hypothetical protein